MRVVSISAVVIFIFWIFLAIIDMWFDVVSWEFFGKLTITILLLAVVVFFISYLQRESKNKSTHSEDDATR